MYRPSANNVDQLLSGQEHLPKLPVPDLRQTMDKYIASVTPHLTADQLVTTKEAVRTFLEENGDGERLQKKLKERADKLDNWLLEWWTNLAYLAYREPLVINSSPAAVFSCENVPHTMNEALQYATKFIMSSALYFHSLAEGKLPFPLPKVPSSYSQVSALFGSARVPDMPIDRFVVHPYAKSKHVIVAHNSQFFKLPLYHTDGRLSSLSEILCQLISIVEASPADLTPSLDECVGLLTSEHRDVWAPLYKKLKQYVDNSDSIEAIESALAMMCIDKPCATLVRDGYETLEQSHDGDRTHMFDEVTNEDYALFCQRMLHGLSTADNATNRWYEKVDQVCVSPDMGCGGVSEHSSLDGVSSVTLNNFNLEFIEKNRSPILASSNASLPPFKRLKWNLDGEVKRAIFKAAQRLNADIARVQVRCLSYTKFGKNALKAKRLSMDGFVQVAMQLAFRHVHRRNPVTYESVSTARFRDGRTDTIRSCTVESDSFASAMEDTRKTDEERCTLFLAAITKHSKLAVEGSQGQAFDRHMLGLRVLAMEELAANSSSSSDCATGPKLPAVFEDPAYKLMQHITLSTSQAVSPFATRFCFGPVAPDGYGVSYQVAPNHVNLTVTCFNDCSTTDMDALCSGIQSSLDGCYELLRFVPTKSNL